MMDNYQPSSSGIERDTEQTCLVTETSGYVITAKKDQDSETRET